MNIGVDLGGTKIKAGLEFNGLITQRKTVLLEHKDSLNDTLNQLIEFIRPFTSSNVKKIGIGVPSVVDTEKGIVYNVTNIPSWKEVALKEILEDAFHLPTYINNDVNCFTLGEHKFGQARGFKSAVGLTIGTGLGAGLIIDNKLYKGHNCGAGEIGLLPYLGHNYEYYVGNNFFEKYYHFNAHRAFYLAQSGNIEALVAWQEYGKHMGATLKAVLYVYDPEVIVLGGSISIAYAYFKDAMLESLKDFEFPESLKRIKIFQSNNENIALLGAAALGS